MRQVSREDLIDKVVESEEFRKELVKREYEYVIQLANPDKCAEEWDELFTNVYQKNKSINCKDSKMKILFLKKLSIRAEKIIEKKKRKENLK